VKKGGSEVDSRRDATATRPWLRRCCCCSRRMACELPSSPFLPDPWFSGDAGGAAAGFRPAGRSRTQDCLVRFVLGFAVCQTTAVASG
jgi:hypothetical protein